jgi:hypothetical protein
MATAAILPVHFAHPTKMRSGGATPATDLREIPPQDEGRLPTRKRSHFFERKSYSYLCAEGGAKVKRADEINGGEPVDTREAPFMSACDLDRSVTFCSQTNPGSASKFVAALGLGWTLHIEFYRNSGDILTRPTGALLRTQFFRRPHLPTRSRRRAKA